jgi:hypothetical protein
VGSLCAKTRAKNSHAWAPLRRREKGKGESEKEVEGRKETIEGGCRLEEKGDERR